MKKKSALRHLRLHIWTVNIWWFTLENGKDMMLCGIAQCTFIYQEFIDLNPALTVTNHWVSLHLLKISLKDYTDKDFLLFFHTCFFF